MKSKYKSSRSIIALILVLAVVFGFAADLYMIQIRDNEYYSELNNTEKKYVVPIEAARGPACL